MNYFLSCFLILTLTIGVHAQKKKLDSIVARAWVGFEYGGNTTMGDLSDRYGFLNHIGLMTGFKTKQNYFFGLNSTFLFGNDIRLTGIFDHLTD